MWEGSQWYKQGEPFIHAFKMSRWTTRVKWVGFSALLSSWLLWSLKIQILGQVVVVDVDARLGLYFMCITSWGRRALWDLVQMWEEESWCISWIFFFFPITKRYPESLDSRTHRIESLKFLLRRSAHPLWIRPLYFYVGATWFCGNYHFWGNTRTGKNYPHRFLYCFPQWIRCNAD